MDFCVDLNMGQKALVYSVWGTTDYEVKKTYTTHLIRLCIEIIRDSVYNPIWIEDWDQQEGVALNQVLRIAVEGTVRFNSYEKQQFERIKYNECIFYDDIVAMNDTFSRWVADMVISKKYLI